MEEIVLVGGGGHAKSVADCIERSKLYKIIGYTDVEPRFSLYPYLGNDDVLEKLFQQGVRNVALGIGYLGKENVRSVLYRNLKQIGFRFPVIIDPSAVVSGSAIIEEGAFVGKGAIINSEARIGKMVIINTGALIEHECEVENYSHVAVKATLCGQVCVKEAAFIGAGAIVIQGIQISSRKIVPAGITVRKDW